MSEDVKAIFKYTLGSGSHLNLVGKIIFSPIVLYMAAIWWVLELLFSKKKAATNGDGGGS